MSTFPSGAFPNGGEDRENQEYISGDIYVVMLFGMLAAIFVVAIGFTLHSLVAIGIGGAMAVYPVAVWLFEGRTQFRRDFVDHKRPAEEIDCDMRSVSLNVLVAGDLGNARTPPRVDCAPALACANAEKPRVSRLLTILRDPATVSLAAIFAIVVAIIFGLLGLYGVKL